MTSTDTKQYTLAQLRATKKSLFIRNNTEFLWKLSSLGIQLKPHGQPGSITHFSADHLGNADVLRNIALGKVTISPDFESEMFELEVGGVNTKQALLDQFQIGVEDSPQRRAIDVKDKADGFLERVQRRRVVGQGQQGEQNIIDEFTTPSLIKVDGGYMNPANGEFVPAETGAVAADEVGEDITDIIKSVTVQRSRSMKEN